jgi:hypothetical protein
VSSGPDHHSNHIVQRCSKPESKSSRRMTKLTRGCWTTGFLMFGCRGRGNVCPFNTDAGRWVPKPQSRGGTWAPVSQACQSQLQTRGKQHSEQEGRQRDQCEGGFCPQFLNLPLKETILQITCWDRLDWLRACG